jgi:hypothetical protein
MTHLLSKTTNSQALSNNDATTHSKVKSIANQSFSAAVHNRFHSQAVQSSMVWQSVTDGS